MAPADSGGRLLSLLPRNPLAPWAAPRRAGHPLGGHGGVRHLVPKSSDAPQSQGQGGQENIHFCSESVDIFESTLVAYKYLEMFPFLL